MIVPPGRAEPSDVPQCPACGEAVTVADDVFVGEAVWCSGCGVELEVITTSPLVLHLYQEEEK